MRGRVGDVAALGAFARWGVGWGVPRYLSEILGLDPKFPKFSTKFVSGRGQGASPGGHNIPKGHPPWGLQIPESAVRGAFVWVRS